VTIREGALLHLWGSEPAAIQVEGSSFGDPRLLAKAVAYRPSAKFVVALREPVARVLSRYWYEGRFPQQREKSGEPRSLDAWLDAAEKVEDRRQLFSCVSNYYVKTFAGWEGKPWC
jgi:hypothetical protein